MGPTSLDTLTVLTLMGKLQVGEREGRENMFYPNTEQATLLHCQACG